MLLSFFTYFATPVTVIMRFRMIDVIVCTGQTSTCWSMTYRQPLVHT